MGVPSSKSECPASVRRDRRVVALLLQNRGRLCLLRRSSCVASDVGMWHCITGFLDSGVDPERHVLTELAEETGLLRRDLSDFAAGPVLTLPGGDGDWVVHVYVATARHQRVRLNWEHEDFCWVPWVHAAGEGRVLVPWLSTLVAETLSQINPCT